MAKGGAKSKYETLVKPYLTEINEKVRQGVTEAEIAKALGISVASLNNYRNKYTEFAEALSKDKGADELKALVNAGVEAAKGCYKTNTQTIYEADENGEPKLVKVIEYEQWQPPNASLNTFYVQNFGREQGYSNDPLQYALKKQKQEFDEKLEKLKNWHLDFNK
jgi:transcriptional regulator with XRE-family HTH domain